MRPASSVKVLVDSTAGIDAQLAQRWGVGVVPLHISWGQESFRDGVDRLPPDFYRQLARSPTNPTTTAPNPSEFIAACQAALDSGCESALIVTVTPNMSGTHNHARLAAAEFGPGQVVVLDSGQGAGGQALIAARAVQAAQAGAGLPEVFALAQSACNLTQVWVAVDTLKYLRRSGRVTGPQAALGELIQMKPILTFVDHRLQVVARPRTLRRAVEWILGQAVSDGRRAEQALVVYADQPEAAGDLAQRVRRLLPGIEVDASPVSYVVGGHTGPGLLGVAVRYSPR